MEKTGIINLEELQLTNFEEIINSKKEFLPKLKKKSLIIDK